MTKLLLTTFYFICYIVIRASAKEFQIFVNNVEAEANPDYCKIDIKFHNTTDHHPIVDLDLEVLKDSDNSLTIIIEILKKDEHGHYVSIYTSSQRNLCELLSNPKMEPFLLIMFDGLKHHGNIVDQCPYKKGHYYVKQYKIDTAKLPEVSIEGEFRTDIKMFVQDNGNPKQLLKIVGFSTLKAI